MSYVKAVDRQEPKFVVITMHDEYEQTVRFFISKEVAYAVYEEELSNSNEAYIAELLA